MSKRFLVAVDGSDHGWKATDLACELAKAADAEMLILHVVPKEPLPEGLRNFAAVERMPLHEETAHYRLQRELGDQITKEAAERASNNGVDQVTLRVAEGHPTHAIIETAKREAADMIFLGSRGLGGVTGLLLGSVSHKVMHLAPCSCVAVK